MPNVSKLTLVAPAVDQPGGTLTLGEKATALVLGTPISTLGSLAVGTTFSVAGASTLTGVVTMGDGLRINKAATTGNIRMQGGNGRTIEARVDDTLSNLDFASQTFHNLGIILPASARIDANATVALNIGTATQNQLNLGRSTINTDLLGIPRIDGSVSAALSPLKSVAAIYNTSAGQSIADNTAYVKINYGTSVVDTDSAVSNAGSNWLFTVPTGKGGLYMVDASATITIPATTVMDAVLAIHVNSATVYEGHRDAYTTNGGGATVGRTVSTVLKLVAGDTVFIEMYQNSTAARTLVADVIKNRVSIVRIPGS